jgi:hypothetical protein
MISIAFLGLILPEKYFYFVILIGSLQQSKSISSQPQAVSTDTTNPQTSQAYFGPFLLAVLAAGFFAAAFFTAAFFATGLVDALTTAFFAAGFFVAIWFLLEFLFETTHIGMYSTKLFCQAPVGDFDKFCNFPRPHPVVRHLKPGTYRSIDWACAING